MNRKINERSVIAFRRGNLISGIITRGLQGLATFDVTISFTEIFLARINTQISHPRTGLRMGSNQLKWFHKDPASTTSSFEMSFYARDYGDVSSYRLQVDGNVP